MLCHRHNYQMPSSKSNDGTTINHQNFVHSSALAHPAKFPISLGPKNDCVVFRRRCLPQLFAAFVVVVLLQFLLFLPANFAAVAVAADQNLLVDSELFSADIISQAFVQTGSELHYLRDISHHQNQPQQQQADRGGGPSSAAAFLVPASAPPNAANGSGGGGGASKMVKNGLKMEKGAAAEEVVALFESESTDFGQSPFGVPVQRQLFLSNPTDATITILAITSSSISFHCSFVEQKSLASHQRTSFRVYFLPVLEQFGPQRELIKVHTSIGTFSHSVQGETGGNPYRIRSFLGIRLPMNGTFSAPLSLHNPHTMPLVVSELFVSDCNVRIELNDGTTVATPQKNRRWDGGGRTEAMDWRFRPFETREIGHAKVLGNIERNSTAFIVAKLRKMMGNERGGQRSPSSANGGGPPAQQRRQNSDDGIVPVVVDGGQTGGNGAAASDTDEDGTNAGPKKLLQQQKQHKQTEEEGETEDSLAQLLVVAIGVQVMRRRGLFPTVDLLDFGLVRAGGGPVRPRPFSVFSSLERGVEIESVYVEGQSRGVYLQFESRPPISIKGAAVRGMPGAPVTVASVNIDTDTLLRTPRPTDGTQSDNDGDDKSREDNGKFDVDETEGEERAGETEQQQGQQETAKGAAVGTAETEWSAREGRRPGGANAGGGETMDHHHPPQSMVSVRHGTVVAETRGGNYKVSIPFRALIYRGELEFDTEATAFHHALEPTVRREVTVTNTLPFGLAIWGVELAENATTSFQASVVSYPAVALFPGQSLPVLLLSYTQKQAVNFVTELILHTNVTTFTLPISVFGGDLWVRLYAHKQNEFDFGSVGWDEQRTILFSLSNPNPVTLRLSRLHVPFPHAVLSLSLLGMHKLEQQQQRPEDNRRQGTNVGQLVDKFATTNTAQPTTSDQAAWTEGLDFALPAHTFALFNLTLCARSEHRNAVPHNGAGTFRLQTQFAVYEFPLRFELVDFRLESVPDKIVFQDAFIGTVQTHPIKFFNTFPHDLRVHRLSIADADDDPRFQLFRQQQQSPLTAASNSSAKSHQILIPPRSLLTVANVAFVAGAKCPAADDCYLGIPLDTSDGQWFAYGMKLPQNLAEIDHYLYARLRQKWAAMGSRQRVAKTQLRLDTDRVKNLEVPVEAHLVWPRLLSHSVVHFPLTAVGNFTIVNLTLTNPTTNAVIVQLLPLVIYPDAEFLLDLFRAELPVPLPDPVEMNETLMFSLRDTELFTLRPGSPVPQLREEVEAILGGPVPRFTQTLLLRPGMSTRIRIGFLPNDYTLHSSLLLIRNNLTALEPVVLYGRGAKMHMDIDNKTARSLPLLFEIQPQHLADCANPRRQLHKLPTTLTVRRSFVVRNSGEVSFSVFNISISNTPCENRGFRVLNCDRFRLEPNETTLLDIAYTPDFLLTTNEATLQLYMHMNGTPWTFNLVATIPPHLLSVCHAALPRPPFESMMYYTCVLALTFCFICVVSCAYLEGDRVITCAYRQQFAPLVEHYQKQDEKIPADAAAATSPSLASGLLLLDDEPSGVPSTATALVNDDDEDSNDIELLPPSRRTQFLQAAQDAGPLNKLFWRTLNFILCLFSYVWPLVRGGNKAPPLVAVGRRKAATRTATARKAQQQKIVLAKTQSVNEQHAENRRHEEEAVAMKTAAAAKSAAGHRQQKVPTERTKKEGQPPAQPSVTHNQLLIISHGDDQDEEEEDEEQEDDDNGDEDEEDEAGVVQHPKDPEHTSSSSTNPKATVKDAKLVSDSEHNNCPHGDDDGDGDGSVEHGHGQDDVLNLSDPYLYMKFRSFLDAEKRKSALLAKGNAASGGKSQQQPQHNSTNFSSSTNSSTTTNSEKQRQNAHQTEIGLSNKKRAVEKSQRMNPQEEEEKEEEYIMTTPKSSRVPTTAAPFAERARKRASKGACATGDASAPGAIVGGVDVRGRLHGNPSSTSSISTSSGGVSTDGSGGTTSAGSRGVSSSSAQTTVSSSSNSVTDDFLRQQTSEKHIYDASAEAAPFPLANGRAEIRPAQPLPPSSTTASSSNFGGGVRPEWFDRLFAVVATSTTTGATKLAQRGGGEVTTSTASSTQQHNERNNHQQKQKHRRQHPTAEDEEEFGTAFVWEQLYATKMFQFEQEEEEQQQHQQLFGEAVSSDSHDRGRRWPLLNNENDERTAAKAPAAAVDANSSSAGDDESSVAPEWAEQGIADFATGSVDNDFFALADQSAEFFDQISNGSSSDSICCPTNSLRQNRSKGAHSHLPPSDCSLDSNNRHHFDQNGVETKLNAVVKNEEDKGTDHHHHLPIGWGKRLLVNAEDARIKRIIDTLTEEYRQKLTKVLNNARNPMLDMHQLLDDLCLSPSTFKPSVLPPFAVDSLRRASIGGGFEPSESLPLSPTASLKLRAQLGNTAQQQQQQQQQKAEKRKAPDRELSKRLRNSDDDDDSHGTNGTTTMAPNVGPDEGMKPAAPQMPSPSQASNHYNSLFNIEDPVWKPIGPLDEQQHCQWPAQFMGSRSGSRSRGAVGTAKVPKKGASPKSVATAKKGE